MNYNLNFSFLNISTAVKFLSCILLTIFADFLFFKQEIGWTAGLFVIVLAMFYAVHANPVHFTKSVQAVILLIIIQAFALIEDPNWLSGMLVVIGFVAIAYLCKADTQCNALKFLKFTWCYLWKLWDKPFRDSSIFLKYSKKHSKIVFKLGAFVSLMLIIGLSALFIMLFSYANPVLDGWLRKIDLQVLSELISIYRIVFWLVFAIIIWAVLRPRKTHKKLAANPITKFKPQNFLLTNAIITIALVIFNLLFLLQNLLDVEYLWMGAELPDGMTYAQYAHSGAYPLMLTALLSIGFVLVVLKHGRGSEQSSTIRNLIYFWVVQNIVLVIGSVQRTLLYIDVYHLTLLRVSALIWMGLVASGLILIIARVASNRSNLWLINSNFVLLIATLYICSFVNFEGIIADYNVEHSREMGGSNVELDDYTVHYFTKLETLPSLVSLNKHINNVAPNNIYQHSYAQKEDHLIEKLKTQQQNWRSWTFRNYRIQHQIENMR